MGHLSDWLIKLELSDVSDFANLTTALAAIYIANKTMKISKEQGEIARLHNLLNVRPFLWGNFSESEYSFSYVINNVGTGVSSRTLFPDLEGLCKYLNWKHANAGVM